MYLFNFKYNSFVHTSTKLLWRFSSSKPKDFSDPAAGVYNNVRLPASLTDLEMTIDRVTTNVASS